MFIFKATLAHTKVEENPERDTQDPLFNIYTYSVDQVCVSCSSFRFFSFIIGFCIVLTYTICNSF